MIILQTTMLNQIPSRNRYFQIPLVSPPQFALQRVTNES